ncbi:hypothetical protein O9992_19520 [Vibrio lentus]|nr:hypothetical protein [Vibrio lentus]
MAPLRSTLREQRRFIEMNTEFKLYPDLKTAGRGISIKIAVPDDNKISATGAPIMYRGTRNRPCH